MLRHISDSILKCSSILSRVGGSAVSFNLKQGPLQIVNCSQRYDSWTGYQVDSCRYYSRYSIKFEKRKAKRVQPVKDETPHWPQYVTESDSNQEDNQETRKISLETFEKINKQIGEDTHGRLFAVIQVMGKQFKVTQEDIIIVQGNWAPTFGDRIRFEKILLTGATDFTVVGKPLLPRDLVRIEGTVIEKTLSYTQLHYRFRKRKNYRRLYFYKTPYTMVRINAIEFDQYINEQKEIEGERGTIY